jgi:hypothetical protein
MNRKPTCEGTNNHSTGAGTVSVRQCRKSAHEDFKPYCEIHGLRYQIFRLRDDLEESKLDVIMLDDKLSTSRREYLEARKKLAAVEDKLRVTTAALVVTEGLEGQWKEYLVEAEAKLAAVEKHSAPLIKLWQEMLDDPICECEYGHTCGLNERRTELRKLREVLK